MNTLLYQLEEEKNGEKNRRSSEWSVRGFWGVEPLETKKHHFRTKKRRTGST